MVYSDPALNDIHIEGKAWAGRTGWGKENKMENKLSVFCIYRSAEEDVSVNAIVKDESIWLSQQGMAERARGAKAGNQQALEEYF